MPAALTLSNAAFVANHGTATDDLADPKLTHIIVTKLVPERYKELIKRTSECVAGFLPFSSPSSIDVPLSLQAEVPPPRYDRMDKREHRGGGTDG